jgi:selenocysteine lyase/cysteine desulfurase
MLKKWGICDFDIFDSGDSDDAAIEGFSAAITPDTSMAVVTHVSNVTGRVLPIEEIYSICQRRGIILVVDAAQSGGMVPVNGGDVICLPGHKGLYGPQGTGLIIIRRNIPELLPLTFGGTGTVSAEAAPDIMFPESFEAGTVNCPGIAGLKAGLEFVSKDNIRKELYLSDMLAEELSLMPNVTLHRSNGKSLSVVAFSVGDMHSEAVASMLNEKYGIAVRGGLQCAPLCHKKLHTLDRGVVRASLGAFTKESDIYVLLRAVREISR